MTIHPEGINPTGNTQLVDENTRIVLEFVAGRRSGMCTQTEVRDAARAVLDALAAQTRPHADDERRDLIDLIDIASDGTHPPAGVVIVTGKEAAYYADRILAAGFRRTEVPEPSTEDVFAPGECDGSGTCSAQRHIHGCYTVHRADQCDAPDEYGHLSSEPQGEPSSVRAKAIDALVMTRLSDFAGTDMGVIEQAADAVLAALRAAGGVR